MGLEWQFEKLITAWSFNLQTLLYLTCKHYYGSSVKRLFLLLLLFRSSCLKQRLVLTFESACCYFLFCLFIIFILFFCAIASIVIMPIYQRLMYWTVNYFSPDYFIRLQERFIAIWETWLSRWLPKIWEQASLFFSCHLSFYFHFVKLLFADFIVSRGTWMSISSRTCIFHSVQVQFTGTWHCFSSSCHYFCSLYNA